MHNVEFFEGTWFQLIKKFTYYFYFRVFPGEELIPLFLVRVGVRVPYNAGNTVWFSNVAQEHFKIECPY